MKSATELVCSLCVSVLLLHGLTSNNLVTQAAAVSSRLVKKDPDVSEGEDSHDNEIGHGEGDGHGHGHGEGDGHGHGHGHGDDSGEDHGSHGDKGKGGGHSHFGYTRTDGPARWARAFPACGGFKQSPINLDTSTAITAHKPQMSWWGYSLRPVSMTLTNNGHTVALSAEWADGATPYNWDSTDVNDAYVFAQLHFHWGPDDDTGSEHTLNSEKFPLEMHAVHYRKQLGNLVTAAQVTGGLKVIGILFRISEHNNSALSEVLNGLYQVQHGPAKADIRPFKLSKLIPEFSKQYLTYDGSLTTPPCLESVKWVVYKQAAIISRQQVEQFRHFNDDVAATIDRNYRPVQALNGRVVRHIR